MKGRLLLWILVCVAFCATAQAPPGINYQGVARNPDGSPQTNQEISLRIQILAGAGGAVEFEEIHDVTTNEFGLFSLVIGSIDNSGMEGINWESGDKWLQIEIDAAGGSNFQLVGAQQLFSVPYALYASKSGSGVEAGSGLDLQDNVLSNTAPDQEVKLLGAGNVSVSGSYPEFVITGANTPMDLAEVLTNGNDAGGLSISNVADPVDNTDVATRQYVDTRSVDDADADPANEIQDLQISGNMLSLTLNGNPTVIDLTPYLDNTDNQDLQMTTSGTQRNLDITGGAGVVIDVADNDNSTTNEIQNLSSSTSGTNRTINISGGGTSTTINVADNDNSSSNEIQSLSSSATGTNRTVNISGSTGTTFSIADNDNSATNELQDLSSSSSGTDRTITISGGSGTTINVDDNDNNVTNEIQDLELSGNTLSLTSDPSTVDLSGYVLDQNNNAGGSRIVNVADPVNPQDVVTRNYLDVKDATDYAFRVPLNATSTGSDITFDLSSPDFDEGSLISGTEVTISETGVYTFVVKGSSSNASPATINLVVNPAGSPEVNPVTVQLSLYNESFLMKLNAGDVLIIEAVSTTTGEIFNLQFFGYKI